MSTLKELIKRYVATADQYGLMMDNGDYETANFLLDRNEEVFRQLRSYGAGASRALLKLLNHQSDYVRISAATHLLGIYEKKSLAVLYELCDQDGFHGFNARIVLEDYQNGDLAVARF